MTSTNARHLAVDPSLRSIFRAAADVLIPRYKQMPSASDIGIGGEVLDKVLQVRPDIHQDLVRALERLSGDGDITEGLNRLSDQDEVAFNALTLAATGGYYTCNDVWKLIGYPGQEYLPVDATSTPEYLTNRMLEPVIRRGAIYRAT